jgi:hypothetical protein
MRWLWFRRSVISRHCRSNCSRCHDDLHIWSLRLCRFLRELWCCCCPANGMPTNLSLSVGPTAMEINGSRNETITLRSSCIIQMHTDGCAQIRTLTHSTSKTESQRMWQCTHARTHARRDDAGSSWNGGHALHVLLPPHPTTALESPQLAPCCATFNQQSSFRSLECHPTTLYFKE